MAACVKGHNTALSGGAEMRVCTSCNFTDPAPSSFANPMTCTGPTQRKATLLTTAGRFAPIQVRDRECVTGAYRTNRTAWAKNNERSKWTMVLTAPRDSCTAIRNRALCCRCQTSGADLAKGLLLYTNRRSWKSDLGRL